MNHELARIENAALDQSRRSVLDLFFLGSHLQIDKSKPSLAIGLGFVGFSLCFVGVMAGFSLMTVCWSIVMLAIGLTVLFKIPGRWLAVLLFSLPPSVLLLYYGLYPRWPDFYVRYGAWAELKMLANYLIDVWGEGLLFGSTVYSVFRLTSDVKSSLTETKRPAIISQAS